MINSQFMAAPRDRREGKGACGEKTTKHAIHPAKSVVVIVRYTGRWHNASSFPDSGSGSE
jgi:hypothetical protein